MYTLMHLEKSRFFKKIFRDTFSAKNYKYLEPKSIVEAFDLLENNEVDIIVTAMEIEENKSGMDLIEKIYNSRFKNIPIFVLTGEESFDARSKSYKYGVVDYITKNTPIKDIIEAVLSYMKENSYKRDLTDAKIAVLDDSLIEMANLKEIFRKEKIEGATFFNNHNELLLDHIEYDIYLIGMILKKLSGDEIIKNIRKKNRFVPIIAVSEIDNAKTISHVLLTGANDYIVKPYVHEVLLTRMYVQLKQYKEILRLQK